MRPNLSNILKALGVPTGGTAGQVLKKTGSGDTDYGWANESGGGGREVPTGGDAGQVLKKYGSGDTAYDWDDSYEVPTNGSVGQYLKRYGTDPDQYMWADLPHYMNTSFIIRSNITFNFESYKNYNISALDIIKAHEYNIGSGVSNLQTELSSFFSYYYDIHIMFRFDGINIEGNGYEKVIIPMSITKNGSEYYLYGVYYSDACGNFVRLKIIVYSTYCRFLVEIV